MIGERERGFIGGLGSGNNIWPFINRESRNDTVGSTHRKGSQFVLNSGSTFMKRHGQKKRGWVVRGKTPIIIFLMRTGWGLDEGRMRQDEGRKRAGWGLYEGSIRAWWGQNEGRMRANWEQDDGKGRDEEVRIRAGWRQHEEGGGQTGGLDARRMRAGWEQLRVRMRSR